MCMHSDQFLKRASRDSPVLEMVLLAVSTWKCWLTQAALPQQLKAWKRLSCSKKSMQMPPDVRTCTPTPPGAGAVFHSGAPLHGPSTRQPCPAQGGPPTLMQVPGFTATHM